MYKFHYKWIVNKYGNDAQLLFTVTDSLCFCISSSTDIYAHMYQDKHLSDLSGLLKDSKYYDAENMGVLGKMKDEMGGKNINEFVGLRSKVYSLKYDGDNTIEEKQRVNGINRNSSERIKHEKYLNVLTEST